MNKLLAFLWILFIGFVASLVFMDKYFSDSIYKQGIVSKQYKLIVNEETLKAAKDETSATTKSEKAPEQEDEKGKNATNTI